MTLTKEDVRAIRAADTMAADSPEHPAGRQVLPGLGHRAGLVDGTHGPAVDDAVAGSLTR